MTYNSPIGISFVNLVLIKTLKKKKICFHAPSGVITPSEVGA